MAQSPKIVPAGFWPFYRDRLISSAADTPAFVGAEHMVVTTPVSSGNACVQRSKR